MEEYDILMDVEKKYGFIPVFEVSKVVEKEGGEHKYNALVKNGVEMNSYTVTVVLKKEIKEKIVKKIDSIEGVLSYKIIEKY